MSEPQETGSNFTSDKPQATGRSRAWITWLMVLGVFALLVSLLLPGTRTPQPPMHRSQCVNNLKQIALALYNYEEHYLALPPAYTVDAHGKPLHSWRTLILPFLNEHELYRKIDQTKAWDDPVNAAALQTIPTVFRCPAWVDSKNHTLYLASTATHGCLQPEGTRHFSEITDDHANTLMVLEVPIDRAVPWMAPLDANEQLILSIGPKSKLAHNGGVNAGFCDGSVQFLKSNTSAAKRRALISIDGDDNTTGQTEK